MSLWDFSIIRQYNFSSVFENNYVGRYGYASAIRDHESEYYP